MEESAWSGKCRTSKVGCSFLRGLQWKTWDEVIRNDLKGRKCSKDIAKGKNCLEVFHKQSNPCKYGKNVKTNLVMMMKPLK